MKKKVLAVFLLLALLLVPVKAQGPVVLNPSFEGAFRDVGAGEVTIAEDWYPWWSDSCSLCKRPEYKPESRDIGRGRVYDGDYGQKFFTVYSRHDGGIYQKVPAIEGGWYTFSAWMYIWSSDKDDPDQSTDDGDYRSLVGINPWGDCRATYRTTVWGKETYHVYNEWVQVSVTAQAWADEICLFARGVAIWPVKHSDLYLDSASLQVTQPGMLPTPEPCPTAIPCPANGNCPTAQEIRNIVREEIDSTTLGH